jgi:hypothetical protein
METNQPTREQLAEAHFTARGTVFTAIEDGSVPGSLIIAWSNTAIPYFEALQAARHSTFHADQVEIEIHRSILESGITPELVHRLVEIQLTTIHEIRTSYSEFPPMSFTDWIAINKILDVCDKDTKLLLLLADRVEYDS